MASPHLHLPALDGVVQEELELDPEVQPSTETRYGEINSLAFHSGEKWILLVFPTNVSLDGEIPELQFLTSSLRGLGFHLANIHSTNSAIIDFMTISPFVTGTWRNLVAVVLLDPDFPTPPGPPPTARANIALQAYVLSGGLLIIAGAFQNAFSNPLCFKQFAQDMGLCWQIGPWRQWASVQRCDHNIDSTARGGIQHGARAVSMCPTSYPTEDVLGAFVTNVDENDVWYKRASNGETNLLEALIVMSRVGLGQVGFIGDVNMEAFSQAAMVAMCQWHSLLVQ